LILVFKPIGRSVFANVSFKIKKEKHSPTIFYQKS
jgi:hypothetical protein